ncbi:hypothetical protein ACWCQW_38750 [Streptomyces mirabilis]
MAPSGQFSDAAAAAIGLPDAVLDGELVAVLNVGSGAGPTSPSTSQLEYARVPARTRRP